MKSMEVEPDNMILVLMYAAYCRQIEDLNLPKFAYILDVLKVGGITIKRSRVLFLCPPRTDNQLYKVNIAYRAFHNLFEDFLRYCTPQIRLKIESIQSS
ncbi:hypothetical protein DI09_199p30 [Mitosporidium daphniae]|uniref:Uncharacterized protein n=1 Tax=Mitosporidium daphniae TaxID=1485682 RepID=A0A098VTU6_9MICR|nr:uncharacterized protein DI09_199p30 [Mitosporidium daphniae]KGG52259.1 hypothetical protein DI09_199p30 [Mitosporidium daphniae]|eukprot:XP_013238695.1 uncharacterized protein DI09_199p30 [Mitosporidium daphniae]